MANASTTQLGAWIEQCLQGNAEAKKQLLEHTYERLLKIARKRFHGTFAILSDQMETDDVTQELYLKVLEQGDKILQPTPKDETELATITDPVERSRFHARMFFRRTARLICHILSDFRRSRYGRNNNRPRTGSLDELRGSGNDSSGGFDPGSDTLDPAALAVWTEIQQSIDDLPEQLGDVFCLRWFHELSHQEIADAFGLAEITVRKRWTEARVHLRKRFPEMNFEVEG